MGNISNDLRKRIEEAYGQEIRYPLDCDGLSFEIQRRTGQHLSASTLKRMFGLVGQQVKPRVATMDIIAMFLGYKSMKDMESQAGEGCDISSFISIEEEIESAKLTPGTQIQFTYDPDRFLSMTYIGDNQYIVNESQNSKLLKGDIVRITHLAIGFELLASEVIRNGGNIGAYRAAKEGGLTSLEVLV